MAHGGVFAKKSDYLEIGEYNFTWPGENGTFQDFGSVNYTMPSGKQIFEDIIYLLFQLNFVFSFVYLLAQARGIGPGVHFGK